MSIAADILRRERAPAGWPEYTDRAGDRGGPTKFGVTQKAWVAYRSRGRIRNLHRVLLPDHVRDITEDHALRFYETEHVAPYAALTCRELHGLVSDCSVNHGRARATRWVQAAVGAKQDGLFGPITAGLSNQTPGAYTDVLKTRFKFYAQISADQLSLPGGDPDAVNLRGWINRACEFIR